MTLPYGKQPNQKNHTGNLHLAKAGQAGILNALPWLGEWLFIGPLLPLPLLHWTLVLNHCVYASRLSLTIVKSFTMAYCLLWCYFWYLVQFVANYTEYVAISYHFSLIPAIFNNKLNTELNDSSDLWCYCVHQYAAINYCIPSYPPWYCRLAILIHFHAITGDTTVTRLLSGTVLSLLHWIQCQRFWKQWILL